jgi:monoamine oxidase
VAHGRRSGHTARPADRHRPERGHDHGNRPRHLPQKYYPGKSDDIERTLALDWSRDPWAMACEARTYKPGELRKIWPAVIQPVGRVYFAGAYCDNNSWGMEAASRSAFRVARAIHEA